MTTFRARLLVASCAVWCAAAPGRAAPLTGPRRLFPEQAPITVPPPGGITRLSLPAAVRAECQADLSDVRIVGLDGQEIPFLVDVATAKTGPAPEAVLVKIVDAFREERRPADAPPLRRETFVLETPAEFDAASTWRLVIDVPAPGDFVRRATVTQAGDGERPLVEGRSLFRLRSGEARTSLELPGLRAGRFTIALEGEDGTYLAPAFHLERGSETTPPPFLEVALAIGQSRQDGGTTTVVLDRPPGIVPERIHFTTSTPTFARTVTVRDVLPTGRRVVIGRETIRRTDPSDQQAQLDVAVRPAAGERLEIDVIDQDSPPLQDLTASAMLREVSLVFSAAAGDPAATLLFGGGRSRAPRYDLTALARLDEEHGGSAHLGAITANPSFDDRPLLDFAMRPGATLDARVFSYRRPFTIPASRTGLVRVRLEPADLVNARPDLADVRVVDAEGRQWPYLLERDVVTATVPLVLASANREGRQARYGLAPSPQPLRMQGIELDVDASFVDRPFTLSATDEGAMRTLASGRLRRSAGERAPLRIAFPDTRTAQLELVVQNGDEAPLAVNAARALAPLSELYVPAPPGKYALLVGDAEARTPQYEIASVREAVLALPAVDAMTEAGGPNPSFSSGAVAARRIADGRMLPRIAVWAVLVLAVAVLTLLTFRLVRKDGPAGAP